MDINANSFFFKHYLMYKHNSKWDYPKTMCQLLWRFIVVTIFYMCLLVALASPVLIYIATGKFVTNIELNPLLDAYYGKVISGMIQIANILLLAGSIVIASGLILVFSSAKYYEYKNKRVDSNKEPSMLAKMTIGAYNRIKDKTCIILNIKE